MTGKLYIVATPIGNLADITERAVDILRRVDIIAAEDTRHSARLLSHHGIHTRIVACHEHNESDMAASLVNDMQQGESVALISDAGTPLVSDPGYRLVRDTIAAGIEVSPIPGASAFIAALSVSGLATDRFCFEGFLPAKSGARRSRLEALRQESRTLVFYEAPHRITALAGDLQEVMGASRQLCIARELTKQFEQVWHGTAEAACHALANGEIVEKGEFVVVVEGNPEVGSDIDTNRLMEALLEELSPSAAASVASRVTGENKRSLYNVALALKKR